MSTPQENKLKQALDSLTMAMSTPILSGSQVDWFEGVVHAAAGLELVYTEQVERVHLGVFAEIAEQDPELITNVEQLRLEDENLLTCLRKFTADVAHYRKVSERIDSRENLLEEPLEQLHEAWLEIFARVNKQESAISTALQESLQRDRGAVD